MRKPFLAGNWKMSTDNHSSVELAKAVASRLDQAVVDKATVAVCPPFVYLSAVAKALSSSNISVGRRMCILRITERSPAR